MLYHELDNLTFKRVAQNFQSDLILQEKKQISILYHWFDVPLSEASENSHFFQNLHILMTNYAGTLAQV